MVKLGDVEQPLDARHDLDEGTECGDALHRALVDGADDRLGDDRHDHLLGLGPGFGADGGNGDEAGVVDVHLGTRGVLNAADRLALRADHVTDLVRLDLDGEDARRPR